MPGWTYLSCLLDKLLSDSTVIGKIWLNILFFFRVLVLTFGAGNVWGNENSEIVCETQMPGCEKTCYNQVFPFSHIRFWFLQIMCVTMPTVMYLGYVMLSSYQENKLKLCSQAPKNSQHLKQSKHSEDHGTLLVQSSVLGSYMTKLILKILFEIAFIVFQYYLYGFMFQGTVFCSSMSCPGRVKCVTSQPTEKSIFIIFMYVLACLSLVLNVVEMVYLIRREHKHQRSGMQIRMTGDSLQSADA